MGVGSGWEVEMRESVGFVLKREYVVKGDDGVLV